MINTAGFLNLYLMNHKVWTTALLKKSQSQKEFLYLEELHSSLSGNAACCSVLLWLKGGDFGVGRFV
jgi:hypothetical protein